MMFIAAAALLAGLCVVAVAAVQLECGSAHVASSGVEDGVHGDAAATPAALLAVVGSVSADSARVLVEVLPCPALHPLTPRPWTCQRDHAVFPLLVTVCDVDAGACDSWVLHLMSGRFARRRTAALRVFVWTPSSPSPLSCVARSPLLCGAVARARMQTAHRDAVWIASVGPLRRHARIVNRPHTARAVVHSAGRERIARRRRQRPGAFLRSLRRRR